MSHDLPLFPVETTGYVPPVPPIPRRYFLLAYWPGGWWTAFAKVLYEAPDSPALLREAAKLAEKGWAHIRIAALPERV